jgi:hypothetical protein
MRGLATNYQSTNYPLTIYPIRDYPYLRNEDGEPHIHPETACFSDGFRIACIILVFGGICIVAQHHIDGDVAGNEKGCSGANSSG